MFIINLLGIVQSKFEEKEHEAEDILIVLHGFKPFQI